MHTHDEQENRLNTEGSDRHTLFINCGRALAQAVDEQDLPPSRGKRPEGTFAHLSILCNLRALCGSTGSPRPEPVEGSATAVNHSSIVSSPVQRGLKSLITMSMTVSFPSFSHSSACAMADAISLGFSTRMPWPPWAFA